MDEGKISSGNIQLHYIAEGPDDGEPVLLLHGFPQFSYEWRYQLKALSAAGYRAIAPDLRGYHLSDRPEGVENYRLELLVEDVMAFYQAFGWTKANLVAHDWGGIIGWTFAGKHGPLLKKFVAIDIAHGAAFRKAQIENIDQLMRSWYVWFLQAEAAPEQFFGKDRARQLINWLFRNKYDREVFSEEDINRYREMLSQPGQLTAAFNYYRANLSPEILYNGPEDMFPVVDVPTLLIYGKQDMAFTPSVWEDTAKFCSGPFRAVALDGVGHWAVEQAPEQVTQLILEHLKS